jgi:hypothetical protein
MKNFAHCAYTHQLSKILASPWSLVPIEFDSDGTHCCLKDNERRAFISHCAQIIYSTGRPTSEATE